MKNKLLRTIGASLFLFAVISLNTAWAKESSLSKPMEKVKRVLLVYQQRVPDGATYDAVGALRNQISHFKTRVTELEASKYKSGMAQFYDVIFYLGFNDLKPPSKTFYQDIIEAKKQTVCWVHANIFPLSNREGNPFGFKVGPKEPNFDYLSYEGDSFERHGEDIFAISILDRKKAIPYATLLRENEYIPYAVKSDNFWYVSDLPFFLDSSANVFCDLLHEILEEPHQRYKHTMIRIEDVHPNRDPKQLRNLGKIFKKYNVPFSFAVIPVYTDPTMEPPINAVNAIKKHEPT